MKHVDPTLIVAALLEQGLRVCYVDDDPDRRVRAYRVAAGIGARDKFQFWACAYITGESGPHYDVTVAVDPYGKMNDWKLISPEYVEIHLAADTRNVRQLSDPHKRTFDKVSGMTGYCKGGSE